MKIIDEYFDLEIKNNLTKKSHPSKIYPILNKYEEKGLVNGTLEVKNNKNIKLYVITEKGQKAYDALKHELILKVEDERWQELIFDIFDGKIEIKQ